MNIYENSSREEIIERCNYWKNEFMMLNLAYLKVKKECSKYKRLYETERIKRLELMDKCDVMFGLDRNIFKS